MSKNANKQATTQTVDVNSPEFQAAVAAGVQAALASAQNTPAAVAQATEVDPVQALVAEKGLKFAKGGRTYLTLPAATAVARVLKTGTPEVVEAAGERSEKRRSVTHLVLFRTDEGAVGVHPLYKAA